MEQFDIPVVLFVFKREKVEQIIRKIGEVKPKKIYILADQGRNDEEIRQAEKCRRIVEAAIDWECEVIKNYAKENRGVFENIALGAKWVFEREECAIFLEDDNLPEITFFQFCKEMLVKYENDNRILWVCGTNYLGKYEPEDKASYVFTRHMLPCGWASWKNKFLNFYDESMELVEDKVLMDKVQKDYVDKRIYKQYEKCWRWEREKIVSGQKPISWDYHMNLALRVNGLYGIAPKYNQIRNIGVDTNATHGGNTNSDRLTQRICGMPSYALEFPLVHPKVVLRDYTFEREISKIMLYPIEQRAKFWIMRKVRRWLKIPKEITTKEFIAQRKKIRKGL